MLFSNILRTDLTPKRRNESSFAFMDRSARPEVCAARYFLSHAVSRLPYIDRDGVIRRLRSGNDAAFRSASFEVLLHEALLRLGFVLESHPDLGEATSKRPDFLVTDPSGNQFYLEAVLATERDGCDASGEAMKAAALDVADMKPHKDFLVDIVSSRGDPVTPPPGRKLKESLHAWLDSLDANLLRGRYQAEGFRVMPTMAWSHEAWALTVRAYPLVPNRRGCTMRLFGLESGNFSWVNNWEPLREALRHKATRYGKLDKPLVVAVNSNSICLDPVDEEQALYGEELLIEVIDKPELCGLKRRRNGAWMGPKGPQNCRVSAAWFFNDLSPYTLAHGSSTVYMNPWAYHAAPESLTQFSTARLEQHKLIRTPGLELRDIFK